jgi:hypothetical protein
MRRLLLSFATAYLFATSASVADAQTQDSVSGHVVTESLIPTATGGPTYDIRATSGPSGENPEGEVTFTGVDLVITGRVTCLSVHGNVALIETFTTGSSFPFNLAYRITDSPTGDLVETTIMTLVSPGCDVPEPSYIRRDGVVSGDVVVVDAVPLPTSKEQCKNGGWKSFGDEFRNQGQCVAFVERGPKP